MRANESKIIDIKIETSSDLPRQSLKIFGKVRKYSYDIRKHFEILRKSSKNGRKFSENRDRQKPPNEQ